MSLIRRCARIVRHTPLHPQWLLGQRRIPASLRNAKGLILDIGAADRWVAAHLANGTEYLALDYPVTGHKFYDAKPDIFADACCLPIASASCEGVVCLEVIEHIPDPASAIMEIARVLKPGGRAWLSMPFLYPMHNEPFDFQRYTEFGLRRDAARAHLDVVDLQVSLHAIRTATLMMCLGIAGGVHKSRTIWAMLLLPAALLIILAANLIGGFLSLIWPDWGNITAGHHLELRKPSTHSNG